MLLPHAARGAPNDQPLFCLVSCDDNHLHSCSSLLLTVSCGGTLSFSWVAMDYKASFSYRKGELHSTKDRQTPCSYLFLHSVSEVSSYSDYYILTV